MRRLTLSDPSNAILSLQSELQRSRESRYDHRVLAVLLVARGMSPQEVGYLLGDAPRTIQYWVRRFGQKGLLGLREEPRPGRPRRLQPAQLAEVQAALRGKPSDVGLPGNLWDGKTVAAFIEEKFSVGLKARQCRNLLRQLRCDHALRRISRRAAPARDSVESTVAIPQRVSLLNGAETTAAIALAAPRSA